MNSSRFREIVLKTSKVILRNVNVIPCYPPLLYIYKYKFSETVLYEKKICPCDKQISLFKGYGYGNKVIKCINIVLILKKHLFQQNKILINHFPATTCDLLSLRTGVNFHFFALLQVVICTRHDFHKNFPCTRAPREWNKKVVGLIHNFQAEITRVIFATKR